MIIGLDNFQDQYDSLYFNTRVQLDSIRRFEFRNMTIDEINIDENSDITFSKNKPLEFLISTLVNAKFKNSLEGGNFQLDGLGIESIGVQKRKVGTNNWIDVATVGFAKSDIKYTILDKYIELDQEYEYAVFPITSNNQGSIQGIRNISEPIKAQFDGVFLSDKDNNFHFFMNVDYGDINHTLQTKVHEPSGSKYPIITYGNQDYSTFTLSAWYLSKITMDGKIVISHEKDRKEQLLSWLMNKKPKMYRDTKGDLKMVVVSDNPTISPVQYVDGAYSFNIRLIEIGDAKDNETLREYDLLLRL